MEHAAQKIEELANNWSKFHSQHEHETSQLREKMDNLERRYKDLAMNNQRPDSAILTKDGLIEENYISDYIRKGNIHPNLIRKNLAFGDEKNSHDSVIETSIGRKIIGALKHLSPIREISSIEEISTGGLDVVVQDGGFECDWVINDQLKKKSTDTPTIKKQRILLHELYALPQATQTLLEDACVDVESWLIEQLSYSFAQKEEESFLHGKDKCEPTGILNNLKQANKQNIASTEEKYLRDALIALVSKLSNQYHHNATFLMHKSTLVKIQTLRDEVGRFLWSPKINYNMPETLLGYKVLCSEYMPQYKAESKGEAIILFGDFKSAYKIIDHREIPIMRDPYSNRPFVGFYAVKRVGGDLVNPDALVALTYSEE